MINNHVTSLPVSKRLAPHLPEGWESRLYWAGEELCFKGEDGTLITFGGKRKLILHYIEEVSPAPFLSEILPLLPIGIQKYKWAYRAFMNEDMNGSKRRYHFAYRDTKNESGTGLMSFEKENGADAAALLFIWLNENGHIKEGACLR